MKTIHLTPFNKELIQDDEGNGLYVQYEQGYFFIYVGEDEGQREVYIEMDDQIYSQNGGIGSVEVGKDLITIEFSKLFLDEIKIVEIEWNVTSELITFIKGKVFTKEVVIIAPCNL